jgi:hypothetical protein
MFFRFRLVRWAYLLADAVYSAQGAFMVLNCNWIFPPAYALWRATPALNFSFIRGASMEKHPEHDDKSAQHESGSHSDRRSSEEESTPPSKADLVRQKLKLIGGYALDGFAPVVAVVALLIAVSNNQSSQEQMNINSEKIDSVSASLPAPRAELEKLKAAVALEKILQEAERKKQEEQLAKIIQHISQLQLKMKISPTLEEQLHQPASAPVAAPATADMPAAYTAPVKADESTATGKKTGAQVQILKDAIDKFNRK